MNQKRNKIIVLVGFITIVIMTMTYIVFKYRVNKPINTLTGQLTVTVVGTPFDSLLLNNFQSIALNNIKIDIIDVGSSKIIAEGITDEHGLYVFNNIPVGRTYYIDINNGINTQYPANYYTSYKRKIEYPYVKTSLNFVFTLNLNVSAQRDLERQQSLYLYSTLLEEYKNDHGHYPVAMGTEKIVNSKSPLLLSLAPYYTKSKIDVSKLLDPLSDRFFIYQSGGVHYWLYGYPERVINVDLFSKQSYTYLISK